MAMDKFCNPPHGQLALLMTQYRLPSPTTWTPCYSARLASGIGGSTCAALRDHHQIGFPLLIPSNYKFSCPSHFGNRSIRKKTIELRGMAAASERLLSLGTKIIAVGRNYAAHAKELGNAIPKEPVLFMKPTSSYLQNGGTIEIPHNLETLTYEVELGVVIGKKARDVPEPSAMDFVGGYALALDMTAREMQNEAKASGLPWTISKGQDTFTPISQFIPKSMVMDPDNLEMWLKVDDVLKQKSSTSDMIFKVPFLVSHVSSFMTLFEGDVILTGTPEGVGPVRPGQRITAGIAGLIDVYYDVQKRQKQAAL